MKIQNTNSSAKQPPPHPVPPYRYAGGDLGLTDSAEPWIEFRDANGVKWLTHSVEAVLRLVPDFTGDERGGDQLLADAAIHYVDGAWELNKGYGTVEDAVSARQAAKIGGGA